MRNVAARSNLLVPEVREVMDIRQASDYLGISPDTLYKYASEGFVPAFKLGNRWRFKRSRLDEWMDRQSDMQSATPETDPNAKKPVQDSYQLLACGAAFPRWPHADSDRSLLVAVGLCLSLPALVIYLSGWTTFAVSVNSAAV